jgi:hypothetical protein
MKTWPGKDYSSAMTTMGAKVYLGNQCCRRWLTLAFTKAMDRDMKVSIVFSPAALRLLIQSVAIQIPSAHGLSARENKSPWPPWMMIAIKAKVALWYVAMVLWSFSPSYETPADAYDIH